MVAARAPEAAGAADHACSAAPRASRSPPRTPGVQADVGGMVDEALAGEPRRQHRHAASPATSPAARRTPRCRRGSPTRPTRSTQLVKRVSGEARTGRPATPRWTSPRSRRSRSRRAVAVKAAALEQRIAQALTVPGVDRTVRAPVADPEAEGHPGAARRQVPGASWSPTAYNFKLRLYKNLQLAKEYTVAVGAVGFDTPAGLYHIQNKAVDPAWHVPEQRLGRRSGRHGRAGRRARQPAQGALARHLRRRRHPRHRRDLLARATPPRTAASGWRSRT